MVAVLKGPEGPGTVRKWDKGTMVRGWTLPFLLDLLQKSS